ncbi:MAG TPA: Gfo/Idh/MocA family oxidoreductase [Nitrospiraceae bacterium]|nr:Gfo/Idh/MocA family oxidoreductase [Nitrospiraceae bacterium]
MPKIRTGVIGVGHLGQHHARLYAALPESELIGVFDADPERARLMAERHGGLAFSRLDELIDSVQAVSVAVPTTAHYEVTKRCLDRGRHVLVEKPIAARLAEAQELVRLAAERGCILQVGHSERFNPVMLAARPHIDAPSFIECHRLSSFGERGTDVDVILDLMIHDLDMVLSFNPGPVEEVRAAGVPVLSSHVDIANARIQFGGGCVANLTSSRVSMNRMRRLRVFQRDRYVSVDYQTRHAVVYRRRTDQGAKPQLDMEQLVGSDEEPLKLQLQSFLASVMTGAPAVVSGEAGAAALALAYQVREAIDSFLRRQQQASPSGSASPGRGA